MKICPTCNEEFENELEVCPNDGETLEVVDAEEAEVEAETAVEDAGDAVAAAEADDSEQDAEEPSDDADDESETAEAAAGESPAATRTASSGQPEGISTMGKASIIVLTILILGAGLVFWKSSVGGHGNLDFSHLTEKEMQTLVKDFNPMQLKALAENPEQKKQLVENLEQLLSLASQAKKEGIADDPSVRAELESMRVTLLAINYDRKINANKGPMPQFGFIGEDRVREFWGEDGQQPAETVEANTNTNTAGANAAPKPVAAPAPKKEHGVLVSALDAIGLGWVVAGADARRHEAEFKIFLDNKLELLRKRGQFQDGQEPSEEEIQQAREAFAKTRIYYEEAKTKLGSIGGLPETEKREWEEFDEEFELQAKLQAAQFLVQNFVQEKLSKQLQVSDEEVEKYIKDHPEVADSEGKKKKADDVLQRVKSGGDFAELAKEFSEDPGSKDKGGLYENVTKGQFAPEFEAAALALEPGQVADQVVKTNFGFHIIKLEKKSETKGEDGQDSTTYDVRHILISTLVKDPENPMARELPIDQFVRQKLEKEKQEKLLEEIKKNNPVHIPADFKVPEPSAEELENLKKQQEEQLRQMIERNNPQGEAPAGAEQKEEDK